MLMSAALHQNQIWLTQKVKLIDLMLENYKTVPVDLAKLSNKVANDVKTKT